jgi:hypothetical protein
MRTAALESSAARKTTSNAAPEVANAHCTPACLREEVVRLCAYTKWESAGKPAGDGVQFWLEAERELRAVAGMRISHSRS